VCLTRYAHIIQIHVPQLYIVYYVDNIVYMLTRDKADSGVGTGVVPTEAYKCARREEKKLKNSNTRTHTHTQYITPHT
jgi:hypothetical protein